MSSNPGDENQGLVISYLTLRKAVGILGMILPVLLFTGYFLFEKDCTFPPSISHFYYTDMGNWFIGTLCAVSLFLFSYNGYDTADKIASKIAGLFALLVAMFPTQFGSYADMQCSRISNTGSGISNIIHYISASVLFLTFAFFSLIQFTKSNKSHMAGQKKIRNRIYIVCGWVILLCIVGITLISFIDPLYEKVKKYKPTFTLETIALLAFGFSWLIKGETFFRDEGK